jgi:hypothetical protein
MTQVVDTFVEITHRIIGNQGLEGFLPTLLLPATKKIVALEGAPEDDTLPMIARSWAEENAGAEADFVLVFRSGERHFDVIARINGRVLQRHEAVHAA